eukprot:TRINITY_DN4076_c0_g1_i4.p1 TRINITY_DN4076_c0_g1~~TRINITY_DN4076_c0_g1_i4.p1  ORF type:complete len:1241 (-),score=240.79 TRINITY_DN4076_c0_g1_i4:13-3735(-)
MMSFAARPKSLSAPAARRRESPLRASLSPRREARQESSSSRGKSPRPAQLPWRRREELRREAQALEDPEGAMQNGGSTASTAGANSKRHRSPSEEFPSKDASRAEAARPKAPAQATDDISGFCIGEKVRYWSATHAKWVDAHVQRVYRAPDGDVVSYDLTKKAQAEIWRVRDASTPEDAPAPVEESVAPISLSRGFQLDQQVQYFSETKEKWIDATVVLKYEKEGVLTYDLNCKMGVPADRVRSADVAYSVGEEVEYWSSSVRRWVPAKVLRLNLEAKQCDLSIKPGALLSRVRKATGSTVGERVVDAPRHSVGISSTGVAVPAPPLSCSFKAGDQVQYYSESKQKWLETVVERMFDQDGSVCYDLGCKKGVSADKVRSSLKASQENYKVGEPVEYWSITSGRWLPAKVEAFFPELGHCNLDIKLGAPVGRIRHRACVASVPSDPPVQPPASPPVAPPAVPSPRADVAATEQGQQPLERPAAAAAAAATAATASSTAEATATAATATATTAATAAAAPSEEGQAAAVAAAPPPAEVAVVREEAPAAPAAKQAQTRQEPPAEVDDTARRRSSSPKPEGAQADGQAATEITDRTADRQRRRRGDRAEGGERRRGKRRRQREGSQAANDDQPGAGDKVPTSPSEDLLSESRPSAARKEKDQKPDAVEVSDEDDVDAKLAESASRQRRQEAMRRREAEQQDKASEVSLKPNGRRDEAGVDNSLIDAAQHAMADPKWQELLTAQAEAMQQGGEQPRSERVDPLHSQQAAAKADPIGQDVSKADDTRERQQQQHQHVATSQAPNGSRESEAQRSSTEAGSSDEEQRPPRKKSHACHDQPRATEPAQSSRKEGEREPAGRSEIAPEVQASESLQTMFERSKDHQKLPAEPPAPKKPPSRVVPGSDSRPVGSEPGSRLREEQHLQIEADKSGQLPLQKQAEQSSSDSDDSDAPGWRRQAPRTRQDLSEYSDTKTGSARSSRDRQHVRQDSDDSESESPPARRQASSVAETVPVRDTVGPRHPSQKRLRRRRRKSRQTADDASKGKPLSKTMPKPPAKDAREPSEQQRSSRTVLQRRDKSEGRDRQRGPLKDESRFNSEDPSRDERLHLWRDNAEASEHTQPFRAKLTPSEQGGDRDWQRSAKTGAQGRSGSTRQKQSSRDMPRGRDVRDVRVRDVRDGAEATSRQRTGRERRFENAPWRETSDQGRASFRLRRRPPLNRIRSRSRGSPPPRRGGHSRPRHEPRARRRR